MKKEAYERAVTSLINEAAEMMAETAKMYKYGAEFKRDRNHTGMDRMMMEYMDLQATVDHLKTITKFRVDEFHTDRYYRKVAILRLEDLLGDKGLLPSPLECYNSLIEHFCTIEKWYCNFPISERLERINIWVHNPKYQKYFDAVSEYFNEAVETARRPDIYTPYQKIDYQAYMTENDKINRSTVFDFYRECLEIIENRIKEIDEIIDPSQDLSINEILFLKHQITVLQAEINKCNL